MMRDLTLFIGLLLCMTKAFAVNVISITAEHVVHAAAEASNLSVHIDLNNQSRKQSVITLDSKIKPKSHDEWIQANFRCTVPQRLTKGTWHCDHGRLNSKLIQLPLTLDLTPLKKGIQANLHFKEVNFSDEAGQHAAEKLTGDLALIVRQEGPNLSWENTLNWTGGEMYWQPFFLSGDGHQLIASGTYNGQTIRVDDASLHIHKVGRLNLKGEMQLADNEVTQLEVDLPDLDLATAFPVLFKPLLENSVVYEAEMAGNIAFQANIVDAELKSLDIKLNDVDIEDANQKFAFYKLNAHIPWDYDDKKDIQLSYLNGHLLNIPLGETNIQAQVNRFSWTSPSISLPILDGALNLSDFSAARIGGRWYWHLGADIAPIDMAALSNALTLPVMQGQVSGKIPQVTYGGGVLTTNGEMTFNVFDGQATIDHLVLLQPLSNAPKLNADMHLKRLDLGQLTSTYSFGSIDGRLDGEVIGLEMENWAPVAFDAHLKSSPGKYRKKISQRAVQNISALGGAGAAAAVQRSVLSFFDNFNYDKIALSCKLSKDVCEMNGLESTQGGYTIVKGRGIPAITVKGFNQTVGWPELLERIKRITDGNTKAIVK